MGGHWITSPEQGFNALHPGMSKQFTQGIDAALFGDVPPPTVPKAPGPGPSLTDAAVQAARRAAALQNSGKQGLQSTFAPTAGQDVIGNAAMANGPTRAFPITSTSAAMGFNAAQKLGGQTAAGPLIAGGAQRSVVGQSPILGSPIGARPGRSGVLYDPQSSLGQGFRGQQKFSLKLFKK